MSSEKQSSRMAVLLFTDMVESVALQRRLGTVAYSNLLKLHHQLFLEALRLIPGGRILDDTGDGFLCEFNTAADAVNAALLFQMLLRDARWAAEIPGVRIGIHQGQLAEFKLETAFPGKIVGMPVNIAERVMGLAQAQQILMTRPVFDDARQFVRKHPIARHDGTPPPAVEWKAHGQYVLKGIDDPVDVCEVGAAGFAPLTPPPDSEKARRAAIPLEESRRPRRPAIGATLAVLCGLALWTMPLFEGCENASYDDLFRFGSRRVTNNVVLVLMDNTAHTELGQNRGNWDRALHTDLLKKLAVDECPLVVFDIFFGKPGVQTTDDELAKAIERHGHVVLMAKTMDPKYPVAEAAQFSLPHKLFLDVAAGVGIGQSEADWPTIARKHWPFPALEEQQIFSLPWTAAQLAGAQLTARNQKQWLRYYGERGGWDSLSYHLALSSSPGYFRNKVVFIGQDPYKRKEPNFQEDDKFLTPYTSRTGEAVGGVEIMATSFLNLMNSDWLRRPASWAEVLGIVIMGGLLGNCLSRMSRGTAIIASAGLGLLMMVGAVLLSHFTNFWIPWWIVVGGQIPCALGWALLPVGITKGRAAPARTILLPPPEELPDYKVFDPPIGEGAFGKVWVVQSAIGQWQALKKVFRSNFEDDLPYDIEFEGVRNYKPVSEKHSGLLRVELVSRKKPEGYFFYIMELGDAQEPGWQDSPSTYKPRTLESERTKATGFRLPVRTCVQTGITLAEALDFLHANGLTHRDIKPPNVIFVNEQPKLADVGLVTHARRPDKDATRVGTPGFMPPTSEPQGTKQADIYALGMLLYVISTGRKPALFPELSSTLLELSGEADFMPLNQILLKACQPDRSQRYASAAEMHADLLQLSNALGTPPTTVQL